VPLEVVSFSFPTEVSIASTKFLTWSSVGADNQIFVFSLVCLKLSITKPSVADVLPVPAPPKIIVMKSEDVLVVFCFNV
jgi:hypothetical protein